MRRRLEDKEVDSSGGVEMSAEERETMCVAFLAERMDTYTKRNKHTELNPQKMRSQLPQFTDKEIEEAMQKAAEKEIGTWQRFDAIDIVPPDESKQIRKESPEKVISSRGVWTKKDDEKRDENEKEELVLKCRVVGRGFQEEYDENLRRDSPTCSTLLVQVICSLASSRLMKLTAADVRGAFLQGLKIDRELYFEPPKNLGKAQIPGVQPGALLKLKKSIYGVNDAARQWYHSIKGILLRLGWESLTFELAGFVLRDPASKEVIAILALHVDDVLIAWDEKKYPEECKKMQEQMQKEVEWGQWRTDGTLKFCGRSYHQDEDGTIHVHAQEYVENMSTYKVSRERGKDNNAKLTPSETKAFRGLLGQLQWYARIMGYSIGFQVSRLASEIKDLRMSSLKEASKLVREVKQYHQEEELIFRPGMAWQPEDIAVVAVHDASFNNLPGHKSQKGYWLGISTPELIKDRTKVHHIHFVHWTSSKIQRVVRSTLSAEAYSCSEALDALSWLRATILEVLHGDLDMRHYKEHLHRVPGVTVTDCRSLYDCMKSERVLLSDRRLSLEAAIIRQSLQEGVECKWVPSEQQLADALTKALHRKGLAYLNDVLYSNKWTLGPDPRLPETSRSRKLESPEEKPKPEKVNSHEEAEMINQKPIELEENESSASPNRTTHISTSPGVSAKSVLMISFAQQFLPTNAEPDVRTILPQFPWELMFACVIIVLTGLFWYNTTYYTEWFLWYEDLALYKQGALVSLTTMLVVVIGLKTTVSQNSECLMLMWGGMVIMIVLLVKRLDEKTSTIFTLLGQERKKTQELIHAGMSQMFNENNIMLTGMDRMKHAINEDFKKVSAFIGDSNRFTYQKMDDIAEESNFRITKVIDRLIRIEYKQERQEVRALDLEKRLKQKKRHRTPSMSSDEKRAILLKRQDRREAPGTPTESEVMSMLEDPAVPELFVEPGADGRLAPHDEDESFGEDHGDDHDATTRENIGMTQDKWEKMTRKEKKYFLLTVMWEAACVYKDEENINSISQQMQMLADEINAEALISTSGASSSHHDVQVSERERPQNVEECKVEEPCD